ncbi:hypothetical protein BH10PSE12_BH10PSE12_23470 [soil metagenome]
MPDDVQAALERFQTFLDHYGIDAVIDARSGFTANDAQLLIGEIELAAQERRRDAHERDE